MGWAALAGGAISAAGSIGGSLLSSSSAGAGTEEALAWQKKMDRWRQAQYEAELARKEPFRLLELARGQFGNAQLPALQDYLDNPTVEPGYEKYLKTGLDAIRGVSSVAGSPSSGPAQIAESNFVTDATNSQVGRRDRNRMTLAGYRGAPPGEPSPPMDNGMVANLLQGQGATQAGMWDSIGDTTGQLGMLLGGNKAFQALFNKSPTGGGDPMTGNGWSSGFDYMGW